MKGVVNEHRHQAAPSHVLWRAECTSYPDRLIQHTNSHNNQGDLGVKQTAYRRHGGPLDTVDDMQGQLTRQIGREWPTVLQSQCVYDQTNCVFVCMDGRPP